MILPHLIVTALVASTPFGVTEVPVTRAGVKRTRVSINTWLGEYPGPVTQVSAGGAGAISVPAHASVRVPGIAKACTIKPGLYHPWSTNQGSALGYYTLLPQVRYVALRDATLEGTPFKKADVVTNVTPLAEALCRGEHVVGKSKPQPVEFNCDTLAASTDFRREPAREDAFSEQWIHLQCAEGHNAWIRDASLAKTRWAKPGRIVEYGRVAP